MPSQPEYLTDQNILHLSRYVATHLNAFPARITKYPISNIKISKTHLNAFPARNLRFSSVSWRPHEALNFIFRVFATCYITICIFNERYVPATSTNTSTSTMCIVNDVKQSYLQPVPVPAQYVYIFNIFFKAKLPATSTNTSTSTIGICNDFKQAYLQPVPVPAQSTCNQGTFSGTRKG